MISSLESAPIQAKEARVDLSKIQLESVIISVVYQKFPPPLAQAGKY